MLNGLASRFPSDILTLANFNNCPPCLYLYYILNRYPLGTNTLYIDSSAYNLFLSCKLANVMIA